METRYDSLRSAYMVAAIIAVSLMGGLVSVVTPGCFITSRHPGKRLRSLQARPEESASVLREADPAVF